MSLEVKEKELIIPPTETGGSEFKVELFLVGKKEGFQLFFFHVE